MRVVDLVPDDEVVVLGEVMTVVSTETNAWWPSDRLLVLRDRHGDTQLFSRDAETIL